MDMSGTDVTTVVRQKTSNRVLVAAGFPVLGAVAGWLLKLLAHWAASWPWIPWEGPVKLIDNAPEPAATIVSLLVGALAGGVLVLLAEHGYVTVTIEDDQVTTARGDASRSVPRHAVHAVFADGGRLVVLGSRGEELAVESKNEGADLPSITELEEAFRAHGYPWLPEGDPYRDTYRRWVEDTPDLPAGGNALFKARSEALRKNEEKDIADLRKELARLGVVVRDEGRRQWWRRVEQGEAGGH
ncbi:hypothetical protein GCM10010222_19890 [Streptomyces tanashiensis]|uniref:YqeB family protein n=1 Tax=Streptomyces tanashiensis TaxID=67367 RepID=UPI00167B0220|nr:hypothetical protein [Streptomyces tanashiensis]GGS78486.1 hypothetical protein GCM10010222_19890 [Streptomyces tanashiensis]